MAGKRNRSNKSKIASPSIQQGQRLRVHTSTDKPPGQLPPVFSLEYLDSDKYSLDKCDQRERADFAIALYRRSRLTWNQIQCAHKHGLGSEPLPHSAIKAAIPEHVTPEVTLLAFRFSDKKPMVGYRRGRIFYVLWLDRKFALYDHGS